MDRQTLQFWSARAEELIRLREYHAALECYVNAVEINPKDADVFRQMALILIQLERYPEAVECLEKEIQTRPKTSPKTKAAWYAKAWVRERLGQHLEAIRDYDRAIEIDENYAAALNDKAYLLANLQMNKEANEPVDHALRIENNNPNYLDTKGFILYNQGLYDQALAFFGQAVAKSMDAEIWYHMGNTQFQKKDYDNAIKSYDQALKAKENFPEAHDAKAVALSRIGNRSSEALEEVRRALQINPSLSSAQEHLARLVSVPSGRGGGEGFMSFWTSTWLKKVLASIIIVLAIGFVGYSVYVGDVKVETKVGPAQNMTITTTTENKIPDTSLVIAGLIVVILLLPELSTLKIGPGGIELELTPHTLPPAKKPDVEL